MALSIENYKAQHKEISKEPHVKYRLIGNRWNGNVSAEPFCSVCDHELFDENQKFCDECGARLSGEIEDAIVYLYVNE